jgi:hypothetical protein
MRIDFLFNETRRAVGLAVLTLSCSLPAAAQVPIAVPTTPSVRVNGVAQNQESAREGPTPSDDVPKPTLQKQVAPSGEDDNSSHSQDDLAKRMHAYYKRLPTMDIEYPKSWEPISDQKTEQIAQWLILYPHGQQSTFMAMDAAVSLQAIKEKLLTVAHETDPKFAWAPFSFGGQKGFLGVSKVRTESHDETRNHRRMVVTGYSKGGLPVEHSERGDDYTVHVPECTIISYQAVFPGPEGHVRVLMLTTDDSVKVVPSTAFHQALSLVKLYPEVRSVGNVPPERRVVPKKFPGAR